MAENKSFAEMTKEEQLKEVNNAIYAVLAGGSPTASAAEALLVPTSRF